MNLHGRIIAALAAAFVMSGCQTIGSESVQRDRLDYANAIGTSWKEQTLLNIVKLRYLDTPVFLDVTSVISSYELASQISLGANAFRGDPSGPEQSFGATGTYTDMPTISYTPITGERYMNSLIRPLPPQAIFSMIESGHPADLILQVTVRAINGLYNYTSSQMRTRPADPTFQMVIDAIRDIQQEGALSVRVEKSDNQEATYVGFLHGGGEAVEKNILFVKDKLGINPESDEALLVYGARQHNANQIALQTRSVQEILSEFSVGVEVPKDDLAEGRATVRSRHNLAAESQNYPLIRIQSGNERPTDFFAMVPYHNHWFWIDDRDLNSKRMFMFLSIFSALAETGIAPQTPLITIPAR